MAPAELMIVSTTFADREKALAVSSRLVAAGLAACGQVGAPVQSCYRWAQDLHQDQEYPALFKVPAVRLEAFVAELKSLHPYEVPQILAWPASFVDPDYLAWACGGG